MCAPEYTSTIVAESPHGVLHQGDCLEIMPTFAPQSVDMVLCDLPYGTTQCKWDTVIPFEPLWKEYKRLIKPRGAIVLTASQPFTSALVMSNVKEYRHHWVWNKNNSAGFATVKIRPFPICEDILVFGVEKVQYSPQMETRGKERKKGGYSSSENYGGITPTRSISNVYYPKNLLSFPNASQVGKTHPTQKPVALFEYLIKTYTQPGAVVLDNCAGSGTTGAACINTGRKFLLIEREQKYVDIIEKRVFSPAATLFSSELDKTTV